MVVIRLLISLVCVCPLGILSTARETPKEVDSPLLNFQYRREQLMSEKESIRLWKERELAKLGEHATATAIAFIDQQAKKKWKAALSVWSNDFYLNDDTIAPLRGALAVWGLTIDDLGTLTVVSECRHLDDR